MLHWLHVSTPSHPKSDGSTISSTSNAASPFPSPTGPQSDLSVDKKFLDLFLSIHGDFYVLNPLSTFSWQAYVVRVCLGTLLRQPLLRIAHCLVIIFLPKSNLSLDYMFFVYLHVFHVYYRAGTES